MASLLTGRVPFFDGGHDDQMALAEVALLCGTFPYWPASLTLLHFATCRIKVTCITSLRAVNTPTCLG
eukprot:2255758-Pyramimonas_sp.AAC.1